MLGHHACIGQHRHEVRIPIPTRNDVKMEVSFDACSGRPTEVKARICAMWLKRPIECLE